MLQRKPNHNKRVRIRETSTDNSSNTDTDTPETFQNERKTTYDIETTDDEANIYDQLLHSETFTLSTEIDQIRDEFSNNLLLSILKLAYIVSIFIACTVLLYLMIQHTCNAIHVFCWIASFATIYFLAYIFYIVLFSTNLSIYRAVLREMPGTVNVVVPEKIIHHRNKSWQSLSQMMHVHGSSQQSSFVSTSDIGSLMAISSSIVRLFDISNNIGVESGNEKLFQIIGSCCLISAGVGVFIMNNFRLGLSASFKALDNWRTRVHHFGGFLYAVVGGLALVFYKRGDWLSLLLLSLFIFGCIVWQVCKNCFSQESEDRGRVHNISRLNIVLEVLAMAVSALSMTILGYDMGTDSCI